MLIAWIDGRYHVTVTGSDFFFLNLCPWLFVAIIRFPYKLLLLINDALGALLKDPPIMTLKGKKTLRGGRTPPITFDFISAHYSTGIHLEFLFSFFLTGLRVPIACS